MSEHGQINSKRHVKKMSTYANTGCQSDDLRSGTDSLEEWRV